MIPVRNIFAQCRAINGKIYLHFNNEAIELDDVGELIWINMNGRNSVKKIAAQIATKFNVNQTLVEEDVLEFISDLKEYNLVDYP